MPLPNVLTVNNWKNQGLTLRTTLDKIKKLSTGVSDALRDLATAYNLPDWEVQQKHNAYVAANQAITATSNAHVNNAALTTLLNNMRNALPHVKQDWEHAIDGLTMNQTFGTAALYNAFHTWAATQHIEESVEFLKAHHDNVAVATLYQMYISPGAPKQLNVDDNIIQAIVNAPGHNNPAMWAKVHGAIDGMIANQRFAQFKQSLKHVL
jgi:hypothetical protein